MQMTEKFSHAYLVESLSRKARENRVSELAAAMVCSGEGASKPCRSCRDCRKAFEGIHPDIQTVRRLATSEGKQRREIYVDQVRALVADAPVLPNEAARKVYVIEDADTMNRQAQNALLKLLEEPPAHLALLLSVSNASSMLETIRSRCVLDSINEEDQAEENSLADAFLRAAAERSPEALIRFCTENEGMDTRAAADFLSAAEALLADALCLRSEPMGLRREELARLLELVRTGESYLRANVGVKHVFGLLQTASFSEK